MKKEELFDVLGDLDDPYIKAARGTNERTNRLGLARWRAVAACLAVLVGISVMDRALPEGNNNTPTVETFSIQTDDQVKENHAVEEFQINTDLEVMPTENSNAIVVNEMADIINTALDMDVQMASLNKLPQDVWSLVLEEFHAYVGISYEEFVSKIPGEFQCSHFYSLSIPGYKDADLKEEYRLHDYVFEYQTENGGEAIIAICSWEKPLRDYLIACDDPKQSQINDVNVLVYGYQNSFMVQFLCEGIYYDVETINITLVELERLLMGLTETSKTMAEDLTETAAEDVPADYGGEYIEAVDGIDLDESVSEFYGGSYLDDEGRFVIVLTEDTPANRAAVCKELGRRENETVFVKGTYTLAYLTDLQTKISNAMVNKEIPFVVMSGVYEDTNSIVIRATTDDETELAKVYALDTIGGAIQIEQSNGMMITVTEEIALPKDE